MTDVFPHDRPPAPVTPNLDLAGHVASFVVATVLTGAWLWLGDRLTAVLTVDRPIPLDFGASFALAGGHILVAGAACLLLFVLGGLWWASARLTRKESGRPRATAAMVLIASAAILPAFTLSEGVVGGEWIRTQEWVGYLRWGIFVGALGAAGGFGWLTLDWSSARGTRRRVLFAAAALAGATVVAVADALLFPGLYPGFHLALYVGGATVAAAGFVRLVEALLPSARKLRWAAAGGAALLAVLALVSWLRVGTADRAAIALASPNARTVMKHTAPREKGHGLRSALQRLDVAAGSVEAVLDPAARAALTGGRDDWNVIVIVVDALRADALPPARYDGGISASGDTPFLDQWLEGAYRFRTAYSPASATVLAMPALFSARDAYRSAAPGGLPVAERFRELGREPVAVVNDWFLLPVKMSGRPLLEGFGRTAIVRKPHQSELPELLRGVLKDTSQPLFAWIHVYTTHEPYYAGKLLGGGTARGRYQKSLRYTDGHLAELFAVLEEAGLRDNTIVVLTADHGECFGEHRKTGHGATVFDEDIRVPFAIHIPGTPGAVLDQTVGTVDLLPTLVDLLGAVPEPGLAGRSLVPLLADPIRPWPRAYTLSSGHRKARGVVRGRSKLLYDNRPDTFFLFQLEADPDEISSLLGLGAVDADALFDLWHLRHTDLSGEQLEDPETDALLRQRLADIDPAAPGEALVPLLELVERHPSPERSAAVEALFTHERASATTRLLAARTLAAADPPRAARVLGDHLRRLASDPAGQDSFVDGLWRQRQPAFAEEAVREGLRGALSSGDPDRIRPWLALVLPWKKRFDRWVSDLNAAAEPLRDDRSGARLLCHNAASLHNVPGRGTRLWSLAKSLLPHVDAADPALAAAAVAAVGHLRYRPALVRLHALVEAGPDVPAIVRQALIGALQRIDRAEAAVSIAKLGRDERLASDAIPALRQLRDERGLELLDHIAKKHHSGTIRKEARAAAKTVREHLARQKTTP